MAAPFAGVFEKMEFPPYKFVEYPKWITLADKSRRLVQNQREELALVAEISEDGAKDPVVEAKIAAEQREAKALAEISELKAKLEALEAEKAAARDRKSVV